MWLRATPLRPLWSERSPRSSYPPRYFLWGEATKSGAERQRGAAGRAGLSLSRFGHGGMNRRHLGFLLLDRSGELLRRAGARRRTDAHHAGAERRIGDDGGDVGDDALPDVRRHVAPAVEAGD